MALQPHAAVLVAALVAACASATPIAVEPLAAPPAPLIGAICVWWDSASWDICVSWCDSGDVVGTTHPEGKAEPCPGPEETAV